MATPKKDQKILKQMTKLLLKKAVPMELLTLKFGISKRTVYRYLNYLDEHGDQEYRVVRSRKKPVLYWIPE